MRTAVVRSIVRAVVLILLGTLIAATGLVAGEVAVRVTALAVTAVVAATMTGALPTTEQRPSREHGWRTPFEQVVVAAPLSRPTRSATLRATEDDVALALPDARRAHGLLRQRLRRVARHRLETSYATSLDDEQAAAAVLGAEAWAFLRPDRPVPPPGRRDPEAQLAEVEAVVRRLEEL